MKISNAGPPAGPGQTRRVGGRSGDAAGAFARQVEARPAAARNVAPATPLAALNGVLAIQEVPDATAERRRAIRRGHALLDELDAVRLGLLDGHLAEARLRRLDELLGSVTPPPDDPQLAGLIEEIELRAALELAKLRRGAG